MPPNPKRTKPYASDAIEELLKSQRNHSSENWLLSYLDVFVLVVMLMVTLISISDFKKPTDKNAPKPKNRTTVTEPIRHSSTRATKLSSHPVALNPLAPKVEVKQSNNPMTERRIQTELNNKIKLLGLNQAVHMTVSQGYAQLEIQNKVLFRSSEAELTETGKEVLGRVVPLLKEAEGLIIIEGHTDNRPIKTARFPTNWELSAARANSVLHFLTSEALEPERLHTSGYADTKPIADNSTPEGREKNRRVNIMIKVEDKLEEIATTH